MAIHPLPQFEADLKEFGDQRDRELYERLKPPTTIVVRYGSMKMIGEFPYKGESKPGCGSKIVVRSFRGVEMGEMLTSTCPNSGCAKSVSRQEMLQYIENSGGRQYPFSTRGEALRVATAEDLDRQSRIEQSRHALRLDAQARAKRLAPRAKIVEVEPILSGDRLTVYYTSEDKVETLALQRDLQQHHQVAVDIRQVGARDEARLVADYERCGQYCCCKNFLKVLKPISMRSAKVQKATLDPLKISGRCGRLMCCLRYEDETYESLRKRLPKRKNRVGTPEGDAIVIDAQILTQLVLVEIERTGQRLAFPVEELGAVSSDTPTEREVIPERGRGGRPVRGGAPGGTRTPPPRDDREGQRGESRRDEDRSTPAARRAIEDASPDDGIETDAGTPTKKRKRRRRRKGGDPAMSPGTTQPAGDSRDVPGGPGDAPQSSGPRGDEAGGGEQTAPRKKRRRRKRRKGGGGDGTGEGPGAPPESS